MCLHQVCWAYEKHCKASKLDTIVCVLLFFFQCTQSAVFNHLSTSNDWYASYKGMIIINYFAQYKMPRIYIFRSLWIPYSLVQFPPGTHFLLLESDIFHTLDCLCRKSFLSNIHMITSLQFCFLPLDFITFFLYLAQTTATGEAVCWLTDHITAAASLQKRGVENYLLAEWGNLDW